VFAFEFGIALASGGLATIAAARSARRIDLFRALNTGDATSSTHDKRTQSALVVTQITLAVSLTIAAGLLLRSFQRFTAVSLGFDTERVTTALVAPRSAAAPRAAERFLSDVRTILAMESAALVSCLPLDLSCGWGGVVAIEGRQSSSTNPDYTALNWVTPGYLRTVRIPVLKGRDFDERDRAGSAPVALVNETFVRRYLAGRDPIGVLVTPDDVPAVTRTVVGVVGDVHQWGPAWAPIPEIYLAHAQSGPPVTQLVFRSTVDLAGIERRVSAAVLEFSGDIVVGQAKPLAAFLESRVQQRRYSTIWSIAFAATSILMAGLGVYGVMSLSVVRRRRELAIRAALGAQRSQLIGLVLASGARVIGVGVLFGAAGAFVATRWLRSVLFDVDPGDPAVYVFSTLVLMLVAVAAMFVPAARASFTDPVSTLRAE